MTDQSSLRLRARLRALWPLALLTILLLCPARSQAQLQFTLSNPVQNGIRGQTLTYSGSLVNSGTGTVFLNGASFNLAGTGLTPDETPFLVNAPLSLAPGQSYVGSFFEVFVALSAPTQISTGTFTIVGGPTDLSQNTLATQSFSVVVGAPEPASIGLCLIGAALLLPVVRRQRPHIKNISATY